MIELIDEKHGRVRYTPRQDRVAYPLTRDDSAIPQNPISDQQTRQHFLDLSCFAEIWWRRHGASGNNGVPVSTTAEKPPWRPIWPSRELEFDRENLNPATVRNRSRANGARTPGIGLTSRHLVQLLQPEPHTYNVGVLPFNPVAVRGSDERPVR